MPGANLTRDEARERAATVTAEHYDVALDLTTGDRTFRSTTTVRFGARAGAATFVDLIADRVFEVVLNGRPLDVDAVVGDARIALAGLAERNELRVVADCRYMTTGEGLHRFVDPVDGEVYLYSQFEVADSRRVFAVFEQPDLKASFAFTVTAPAHWTVVSNAPTPEPVAGAADASSATWRFAPTARLSSYVTAIVAGPYHREGGELTSRDGRTIPLGVYCRRSLAQYLDAENVLDITRAGFAFYEDAFDLPYPFAKYDQLFVPEFNAGAMENAGAVTFLENYVFRSRPTEATVERRAVTILHELAHMWFGDLVTMRWWDDLWLNESFAEYASTLATADATRWTSAWTTFSSLEKSWAYRQDQLPSTHPVVAEINDLEDVEVNFDGITYAKGASVLKQLVAWVGQDAFLAGVRRYFRTHAWGNSELRDLLVELEAASGRDLAAWSRLWLEEAGVTLLRPEVRTRTTSDGTVVIDSLAVLQEVPAEHPVQRPHRLAIGGYEVAEGRVARTWRVELDVDGERTPVPDVAGRALPDLLLLNDDDLAYAKIRLDGRSLATAVGHLRQVADSLPRSMVWAAAWDMTRDAEWSASQFLDLVMANVGAETDSTVVLVLLRQLATTLDLYVAPERRPAVAVEVGARLAGLARAAEPGSDAQLQLARAAAARAVTPEQLADVRGWLEAGDGALPGLVVDTDLRWDLLTSLVAAGAAGEDEIAAQLAADPTAAGERAAAGARAAVPTARAKAAAWASVVDRDDLPNAVQAAVIAGFARGHDRALLVPFVEPYFAALEDVWATRTNEIAQGIVVGLYPTLLAGLEDSAGVDVLARTDTWLAQLGGRTPALRRLVVEARDGVRRALEAQARDRAGAGASRPGEASPPG
jgi:aminopeptidase N